MKMFNAAGQAVYFNQISKNGKTQYVVKALSGQHIKGRDGQRQGGRRPLPDVLVDAAPRVRHS